MFNDCLSDNRNNFIFLQSCAVTYPEFFWATRLHLGVPLSLSATMVTCYLNEWKHFCRQSLLSIRRLLFIFCLLSHFNFFNVFLCWIATEKKEVKKPFLGTRDWVPNRYTRLPNGLDTSLLWSNFKRFVKHCWLEKIYLNLVVNILIIFLGSTFFTRSLSFSLSLSIYI